MIECDPKLIEWIQDKIREEKDNLDEIRKTGGNNTPASGMAMGAIDAYHEILEFIRLGSDEDN